MFSFVDFNLTVLTAHSETQPCLNFDHLVEPKMVTRRFQIILALFTLNPGAAVFVVGRKVAKGWRNVVAVWHTRAQTQPE